MGIEEVTISGAIKWTDDRSHYQPDGHYAIRNRIGQGWGLPTDDLTPADLRAMADHLECIRGELRKTTSAEGVPK